MKQNIIRARDFAIEEVDIIHDYIKSDDFKQLLEDTDDLLVSKWFLTTHVKMPRNSGNTALGVLLYEYYQDEPHNSAIFITIDKRFLDSIDTCENKENMMTLRTYKRKAIEMRPNLVIVDNVSDLDDYKLQNIYEYFGARQPYFLIG